MPYNLSFHPSPNEDKGGGGSTVVFVLFNLPTIVSLLEGKNCMSGIEIKHE